MEFPVGDEHVRRWLYTVNALNFYLFEIEGNTVNVVATTNFSLALPASTIAFYPVRAPQPSYVHFPASASFSSISFYVCRRIMADTASAPAAPAQASPKKSSKPKKAKSAPSHPRTSEMVNNAIKNLKERGGSSLQAIKKYISQNYKVDAEKLAPFIKKYLRSAVASGSLVQTKGKGASGSFKLSASSLKDKPEGASATKAKRSASKEKKPAKKAAAKRPKKTGEKKKTAAAKPKKSPSKVKKAKTPKKPKAPKPKKATAKPKTAKKAAPKKK
jgi:hypothetical protein